MNGYGLFRTMSTERPEIAIEGRRDGGEWVEYRFRWKAGATDEVDALCLVPGVGKKTAQRLVLELKNKLDVPDLGSAPVPGDPSPAGGDAVADVRDALASMGFTSAEIAPAVAELEGDDVSALLREALLRLAVSA